MGKEPPIAQPARRKDRSPGRGTDRCRRSGSSFTPRIMEGPLALRARSATRLRARIALGLIALPGGHFLSGILPERVGAKLPAATRPRPEEIKDPARTPCRLSAYRWQGSAKKDASSASGSRGRIRHHFGWGASSGSTDQGFCPGFAWRPCWRDPPVPPADMLDGSSRTWAWRPTVTPANCSFSPSRPGFRRRAGVDRLTGTQRHRLHRKSQGLLAAMLIGETV